MRTSRMSPGRIMRLMGFKVERLSAPIKGLQATYLFTTQFPWTNIATFWMPRRTATESTEGPRRLIKLAKGMTFTEDADTSDKGRGAWAFPCPLPGLQVKLKWQPQPMNDNQHTGTVTGHWILEEMPMMKAEDTPRYSGPEVSKPP